MIRSWDRLGSRNCGDFAIFRVREDRARSPRTGRTHPFYVVESADWVNCLPVTEDGRLVCIRQYRHGSRRVELEMPGGLVDEGEDPRAAAEREMREETGFVAKALVHLGTMRPNPAIQSNTCHFYMARHATRQHGQHLDSAEDIEVVLLKLADVPKLVSAGEIRHGISLVGLFYLDLYLRGIRPVGAGHSQA